MSVVIDTSALMAFIKDEPGADLVEQNLPGALVSPVIFAECLSKLANQGYDAEAARDDFLIGGLEVPDFTISDVSGVQALHALALRGVSLADRFCLALALDRSVPVLTADRPWVDLGLPIEVRLIR